MSAEKSRAVIIRLADFSESSRVVTMFTRELGKVGAIAKGAKRLKGPFQAALDLLAECEVVFLRKSTSGLDILTEARLLQRFKPTASRLSNLYAGYYVAELLDALSEEHDPHPLLYDETVSTLERLSTDAPCELSLLRFELVILREIGQLPAFDECVLCGAPASSAARFGFRAGQGGIVCPSCLGTEPAKYQIASATTVLLRRLAGDDPDWQQVAASPDQHREMRTAMTAAVTHVLGRRPKMLRYLPS